MDIIRRQRQRECWANTHPWSCKSLLTKRELKKLLLYYYCFARLFTASGLTFPQQNADLQQLERYHTTHTPILTPLHGYTTRELSKSILLNVVIVPHHHGSVVKLQFLRISVLCSYNTYLCNKILKIDMTTGNHLLRNLITLSVNE